MLDRLWVIFLSVCFGISMGMSLGWFPPRHQLGDAWDARIETDWITPEDRARAKEVTDNGYDDDLTVVRPTRKARR